MTDAALSVAENAARVLARLREKGWRKHHTGTWNGPNCIMGAYRWVTGMDALAMCGTEDYKALRERTGPWGVTRWNDEPERTFADVEALLTEIAEHPAQVPAQSSVVEQVAP